MILRKNKKYNNRVISTPDGNFDSQKEYTVWRKLKHKQELGEIKNLQRQVKFELISKSEFGRCIYYIADYTYYDNIEHCEVVADCKSIATQNNAVFKLKARLFAEKYKIQIKIM